MLPSYECHLNVARAKYLPSRNRGIQVPKEPTTIGGHLRRRRLQLKIHQSEAAHRLGVSTVSLSRWERDHTYPTWDYHGVITDYLGYDAFGLCGLRDPYSNETNGVASLSNESLGQRLKSRRLTLKLTVKECAKKLNIDPKTVQGWESGSHQPLPKYETLISRFLNCSSSWQ